MFSRQVMENDFKKAPLKKGYSVMKNRMIRVGWFLLMGLLLVSCMTKETAGTGPDAVSMEGVQWYMLEVAGSPVSPMAHDKQPHIMLDPVQKRATGFSGCNNFFGNYERHGESLRFGPVGATRMACPDLEMGLETEVFKALDQTRTWKIQDGELLFLAEDKVLARFTMSRADKGGTEGKITLSGTVWQWRQTLYNDDRKFAPSDPENYTVQFRDDGTLSVKADCNQKGGTFSVFPGERRLSIEITHSTMAACPEGSLEDEFVRGLSAATIYFIKDGDLYLDLKYDSGTMRFSK